MFSSSKLSRPSEREPGNFFSKVATCLRLVKGKGKREILPYNQPQRLTGRYSSYFFYFVFILCSYFYHIILLFYIYIYIDIILIPVLCIFCYFVQLPTNTQLTF